MNPWQVVAEFEKKVAEYAEAPYGVAIDSCTNAIFLSCFYNFLKYPHSQRRITLPTHTYIGVAQSINHAGGMIDFLPYLWKGCYRLSPYSIYDSARRFRRGMVKETDCYNLWVTEKEKMKYYYCLSFHMTKALNIGRGGMVLTNDENFVTWARKARFDGRTENIPPKEDTFIRGWHMTMEPEFALRGLRLMETVKDIYPDTFDPEYPDLSKQEVFKWK